tara:strand:- start:55 stop:750 length:696 start_codon:yes stop_codon:yes gene_type:complete
VEVKKTMNRIKFALVVMPRYSITVFIFLLLVAVFFYAGGTLHDPGSKGYSFTRNFFSDLGILSSQNIVSVVLFGMALLVCGLTFMIYFFYFMKLFNQNTTNSKLGKIGTLFGILGAIFFIIVGFTPHNYVHDSHVLSVHWAFRCFFLASSFLTFSIFRDSRFDSRYAYGYLIFAILIFFYIIVLEFGPSPRESDFALVFNVVSQKIIVFVFILSVLLQSLGNATLIDNNKL